MKTIITGDEAFENREEVRRILNVFKTGITEIVSDCRHGPDGIARNWADENNITTSYFFLSKRFQKAIAKNILLNEMLTYSQRIIIFWDGENQNTYNLIKKASEKNVILIVIGY